MAAVQARLRPVSWSECRWSGRRPSSSAVASEVGRQLRPARSTLRGPRDHVHRRRAGPRPADARAHVPQRPRSRPHRSSSTSGHRRAGATTPRRGTRSGFHGAALPPMTDSGESRRSGPASPPRGGGDQRGTDRDGGAQRQAQFRPAAEQAAQAKLPNYTYHFARRSWPPPARTAGSSRSPPACRRGRASTIPGGVP